MWNLEQMNPNHKWIEIYHEFMNGKEIEYSGDSGETWQVVGAPLWFTGENDLYRVKNKWQKEIDAFNNGSRIEWRHNAIGYWCNWMECAGPKWYENEHIEYRIKEVGKPMKYQKEFDAMMHGQQVQYLSLSGNGWQDYQSDGLESVLCDYWEWRIKPEEVDPYAELKEAWENGKDIEYHYGNTWFIHHKSNGGTFGWTSPVDHYRIVEDPLQEYKDAFARGEKVQVRSKFTNNWHSIGKYPHWDLGVDDYRIVNKWQAEKDHYNNGGTVQFRVLWGDGLHGNWFSVTKRKDGELGWDEDGNVEYRIALNTKTVRRYVELDTRYKSGLVVDIYNRTEEANVEYTFDENNTLINVKFIGKQ